MPELCNHYILFYAAENMTLKKILILVYGHLNIAGGIKDVCRISSGFSSISSLISIEPCLFLSLSCFLTLRM